MKFFSAFYVQVVVVVAAACWFPVAFLKTFLFNFVVPSSHFVPVLFALNHPRRSSSSTAEQARDEGEGGGAAPLRDVYARPGLSYFSK